MKTFCLFFCFVFILPGSRCFSQSILKVYKEPNLSQGKQLVFSGVPLLEYDVSNSRNSTFNFNLAGDFIYWKFTPKQNVGGYADAIIKSSSVKINDTTVSGYSYRTSIYGGMNYYFTPRKIFGSLAAGTDLFKQKVGDSTYDATIPFYVWAGAGYGTITNTQRVAVALDYQRILTKLGVTSKTLSTSGMVRLANLLDRRNYGDFAAKFKEDADIQFFIELEKLLKDEGLVTGPFNSQTTLRLLQALTSSSYIYYPRYVGYQFLGELQFQLYSGTSGAKAHEHYLSLSGVYGRPLGMRTHFLGSAFLSFSLDELASGMTPGFYHSLAFIPNRTMLDFYTQTFGTGLYGGNYTGGKSVSLGARGDIFHSISSFAGIRGYAEIISTKPSGVDATLLMEVGARIDYNILNRLILYAQTRLTSVSKIDASYNFQAGFTYFVF